MQIYAKTEPTSPWGKEEKGQEEGATCSGIYLGHSPPTPILFLRTLVPVGNSEYKNKVPRPMKGGKCYILECLFHFAESISYDLQNQRNS